MGPRMRGFALDAIVNRSASFSVEGNVNMVTPKRRELGGKTYEEHRVVVSAALKSPASIFVKYFADPWRSLGSSDGHQPRAIPLAGGGNAVFGDAPQSEAVIEWSIEPKTNSCTVEKERGGETRILATFDLEARDCDVRIVAVDGQNHVHAQISAARVATERAALSRRNIKACFDPTSGNFAWRSASFGESSSATSHLSRGKERRSTFSSMANGIFRAPRPKRLNRPRRRLPRCRQPPN